MPIEISGMRLAPTPSGEVRILASFDVVLKGIMEIRGCVLVQGKTNPEIWGPKVVKYADDHIHSFKFAPSLRRQVLKGAMQAYDTMTLNNRKAPELSAAVELVRHLEERDAA